MTSPTVAEIGRKTWRTLEPCHAAIYFVPEATEEYQRVGMADRMAGYFASRSAAMGAVPAEVVIATFYNFDHGLVRRSMDGVWDVATPLAVQMARRTAADRMFRRLAPDAIGSAEMAEAASLARIAAEVACERPEGRPLFAGHASLDWPDEPHLVLWHAQTLLREYRGDGHVAALAAAGLTGCEALVAHAATGDVPTEVLQRSRQHSADNWKAAQESLLHRGWVDADGRFTEMGREQRADIEHHTDALSARPYAALGEQHCARLRELARPTSKLLAAAIA